MDTLAERESINNLYLTTSPKSDVMFTKSEFKEIQFKNLKKNSCILNIVVSAISILLSALYIYGTAKACNLNSNYKPSYETKFYKTYNHILMIVPISLTATTVSLTVMSFMMMNRLRYRLDHTDYGRKLWCVIITQIISLLLGTLDFVLFEYVDSVKAFWYANDLRESIQIILINLLVFQLPMLTQLSCLFFGYIRHSKTKKQAQSNS